LLRVHNHRKCGFGEELALGSNILQWSLSR